MNIDEVLLTMGENEKYFDYGARFPKERDKAQCLKLLELLKGHCSNGLHNLDGDLTHRKYECSECMPEIEKLLKER